MMQQKYPCEHRLNQPLDQSLCFVLYQFTWRWMVSFCTNFYAFYDMCKTSTCELLHHPVSHVGLLVLDKIL